ncbi:Glu/Leu/Phe/Val dehydrogenase dimerization domain-containing protein [Nocardioides humi]|uniref:Glu/Leu/Phe/Val dehydrogenase dimerization domain-containing protein n=1 Tax=Nocardioides humi TaxID=449461 RepID=A0ABN2ALV1_9ACTN|nr:Glu/Leu/Phe/Val dehydrogenase dimerization domain-containing protein [Nocardioides humi]
MTTHDVRPSGVFDRAETGRSHEQVVFCRDESTGLRAIISIHDTTLGPALGGTRFHPYAGEAEALADGLRLAEGMTCKAAAAGLPLGGGKAVVIGDPARDKTPALLRSYGRFVERLGGWYVTAADVGTTAEDLDVIGETTRHVVGRTTAAGGSGDSGPATARGVFEAMRAAAGRLWGSESLAGRRVGVEGVGKVGRHLVGLLLEDGASVVVADPSRAATDRIRALHGRAVAVLPRVRDADVDVYAPCALGATLTAAAVAELRASLVCGAANNQLAVPEVDGALAGRGVTWVPDYVANAGGLVQVGGELLGHTPEQVLRGVRAIGDTTREILEVAGRDGLTTGEAAGRIVRQRLARPAHAARSAG